MSDVVEIMARRLAPLAWAALGSGDSLAQENRRKASIRHAKDALSALDAAGYAVVPKEPTTAMTDAALAVDQYWSINAIPRIERAYRAMLSASREEGK